MTCPRGCQRPTANPVKYATFNNRANKDTFRVCFVLGVCYLNPRGQITILYMIYPPRLNPLSCKRPLNLPQRVGINFANLVLLFHQCCNLSRLMFPHIILRNFIFWRGKARWSGINKNKVLVSTQNLGTLIYCRAYFIHLTSVAINMFSSFRDPSRKTPFENEA